MRKDERIFMKTFEILIILVIVLAGFGSAVWQLWNWLIPGMFGLRSITYWQALGLMGLSWILFGGLRGFGMHSSRGGLSRADRERLHRALEAR